MEENVIVTEGLSKAYGKRRGIDDVDLSVCRGEVFGYLGPNGAGKTTTIRTLLDFIRPTRGRATILGLDSHSESIEIHRRTGYLPGEYGFYENLRGEDLLRYFASLRGGVEPGGIRKLAERLDVDLGERIKALSHGTRQKLGLIQAFMHDPELLILDEPTQGIDPLVQQEFHEMLAEGRTQGRTVFLSSHVLPEVERVCDRVGIIREGRLVAIEDVGTLKARTVRSMLIHFAGPAPAEPFARLPGVIDASVQGDVLRLTVTGPLDAVVKTAAGFEVVDLESHEPSLEEIFLTFYRADSGEQDSARESDADDAA